MMSPPFHETVFAATRQAISSGDGGPARDAGTNGPSAIAVDGADVYFADQLGDRIRRVNGKGVISTIAGGGKLSASMSGVAATEVSLAQPAGLAVFSGSLAVHKHAKNSNSRGSGRFAQRS
jgi:hypothetical protein